MDSPAIDDARTQEKRSDFSDAIVARDESVQFEESRMESVGDQDTEFGDETQSMLAIGERSSYSQIPFGFHSRGSYKHASKNCEIVGVTHNSRFKQFVFLDSRGITSWSYESVYNTVTRHLNYPSYQFNVLRLIIFSRKFNVYFALSKEYALKVFNLNFHEVFSVSAEMHSVLCMVFNHGKDELITGGTGGMKFWTFGEIDKDRQKAWERDSRPMANYGLVLRASYPDMGGSWVKQVELDEAMQRLYCLSERNIVAYDMEGNLLFQILDAHRGPVTGCVYSKACNFLVTVGTDCDVNVWSRSKSGGRVHTFTGHSKSITKIMLHPETSALVITAAMDGVVKVNSLDFMEEIYSLPVFSEGIYWMNIVSPKLIYCCSNRVIEVFSLNHLCDFWALSRCSVTSLSLVTCRGKSTRVMAVGNDSSVRLISRKRRNLSTVLPPPPISPLNLVKDVAYSREFNMMYLLIDDQEIWVYYTRTNPATRVESWKLDFIEDIHSQHSQDATQKSRASSPWPSEGKRSPSPIADDSPSLRPSSFGREVSGRESSLSARKEKVVITCVGMLYSPIIMQSVEGQACPDATHFLMAGTQDGRVLFLHLFWKGLKYHQLQANKDAVLELYHDQVMNTLVTKCRHPGIVILIWSLPFLQLLKRVDCDSDMTCFTRMNNLLLCGHNRGYLHLHSLGVDLNHELQDVEDEKAGGSKRSNPRDHQDCINTVDSNSRLEIFCSASRDGVIKIWDRDKTLLREIVMDETLTVASFLNNQGDILIGFKQHIFIIPNEKVYPLKDALSSAFRTDSLDDEAFETESDIYEDPSVRFESKKILQPDPTNMENYLVPFPNLQLKTSWFMEGRPPLDLEQQNQQDEEESISFMSDSLSLAPTEVYCSPSTTPRRMSSVSSVAISERRDSKELWELPEFGESPVSSPPRTPPPEPTPPPTPSPGEKSEEESSEGEGNADEEPQLGEDRSCGQCAEFLKKEGKKKVSIVPTFRKPGGRMGNVSIDSRSLRSGYGGPGYAAPVARRVVVEKPEVKAIKPRRVPKPVIKKTKKPKENSEEENSKEGDNKEQNKSENEENADAKAEEEEEVLKKKDEEDALCRTPDVVNMPPGEQRPIVLQYVAGSRRGPGASAITQEKESSRATRDEENAPAKETEIRGPQDKNQSLTSQKTADGNVGKTLSAAKVPPEEVGNENPPGIESKETDGDAKSGEALQTQEQGKSPKRLSPKPNEVPLVTYVDPDSGEVLQKPADEVPEEAEILEEYDEDEDFEGVDDFVTLPAEGDLTSSVRSERSDRGQKVVSFTPPGSNLIRPSQRNQRQLANFHTSCRDSPTITSPRNAGMAFKETVVPVYDSNRPSDLFSKTSKSAVGVSPLTIFALARSRRENAMKAAGKRGRSADERLRHNQGKKENSSLKNDEWNLDDFELNDDDIARLIDKMDVQSQSDGRGSVSSLRPPSVRKSDSTLMRWCIGALKKADREVLFPPKPTRPSSSPSAVKGKPSKKEGGSTLYLNAKDSRKRPETADTIRSNATNNEELSVLPYENPASAKQTPRRQTRDQKNAATNKINSWRHMSSDEDEDFMDAYRAMRSSIGLHESAEAYMKNIVSKDGNERLTDVREFPTVETSDYSGNWQGKVLERANRLKQQRLERQKTATERRQALENKQREKWKNSNHYECAQESVSKGESVIEFITPPPATAAARNATPLPPQDQLQTRLFKEQELTNEQPYRLRLHTQAGSPGMTPVARNLINLKAGEHSVSDVANVLPKPPPSASIPSKCSRYVLLAQPDVKHSQVQASAMEETLLLLRFPKSRVRRRLASATIPRHHSNRKVHLESGFEM